MSTHHYGHGPQSWNPAPAPARKARRWPWVLGIIAALLVGIGIGGAGNSAPSTSTSSSPALSAPSASVPSAPSADAPEPAAEPDLSAGIGEGTWSVPDQVAPGQYRSAGAKSGLIELCSASTENSSGDVMDWRTGNRGEQVLITVSEDASTFSNSGCEPFVKVG